MGHRIIDIRSEILPGASSFEIELSFFTVTSHAYCDNVYICIFADHQFVIFLTTAIGTEIRNNNPISPLLYVCPKEILNKK